MSELVADCPRCDSKMITFDLTQAHHIETNFGWQYRFEAFCVCRHCQRATVFILRQKSEPGIEYLHKVHLAEVSNAVNQYAEVDGFICLKDLATAQPPDHLPPEIDAAFREAATCIATDCFNAAASMFRLCIDHATRSLLPDEDIKGLTAHIRRTLGLRLIWLFENSVLPEGLKELSSCIKEDGNDGAHAGSLKKVDAEDIEDFTFALLERLYTEPERLRLAKERRTERRKSKSGE